MVVREEHGEEGLEGDSNIVLFEENNICAQVHSCEVLNFTRMLIPLFVYSIYVTIFKTLNSIE